jgi:predicted O-methyltransferase YrrM
MPARNVTSREYRSAAKVGFGLCVVDRRIASSLRSPAVSGVLDRLHALSQTEDPIARRRVESREAELGRRLTQERRFELYGEAPLAITRQVGELLHLLVLVKRPRCAVEFGASLGVSTTYIAAALKDCGGSLVTSESHARKAERAQRHLAEAGLAHLVQLRVGDALQTLAHLEQPVDLLFLDGRNDLYLPVLRLVEPRLSPYALVIADLSAEDPDLIPYLDHVRSSDGGYLSVTLPLEAGVELSTRLPER